MVKLDKIYTRGGDGGMSGLTDGSRRSKADARFAAIGAVDETGSAIGAARLHAGAEGDAALARIQNDLFDLGADFATPGEDFEPSEMVLRIVAPQVARLEDEIDAMNDRLEPLRSFILPAGTAGVSALHFARSVVRRAERSAVAAAERMPLNPQALAYLNRLSDHLFVAARLVASRSGGDVLWVPGASR